MAMISDVRVLHSAASPGPTTPYRSAHKSTATRGPPKAAASTTTLQRVSPAVKEPTVRVKGHDIFVCDEESQFYSQCLEKLLVKNSSTSQTVIEFGSGDGTPILQCLQRSQFTGTIHGYELNPKAAALATNGAAELQLSQRYVVHNSCFFKGSQEQPASCLIANPPYIPAPDNDILMPALHGGVDGANLTRELLSLGFDSAVLLISAYANPVETIEHARQQGYQVTDFMVTPMPFGLYSSEPKVKNWIWKMRAEGKAFCSDNWYLLAGVLFQKTRTLLDGKANRKQVPVNGQDADTDTLYANGAIQNTILPASTGLRHRYAQNINGSINSSEDQTDELLKVMTAFR